MSEKYIIPTPGDTIAGKYHIEEELGRGAYGVVFRARQTGIDRHVALKTLLPKAFLETDIVERFEREAQFVGRLNHPNIVGVHDYGRHENLLYMAVEYVEGDTLEEIISRDGALEPERVRQLVYQLIDALEHAHERGIVHRDLKPANIVILRKRDPETEVTREIVKVLDFGIAKLIQSEAEEENYATLTQAGTVLGTPHYMSPETIVGDAIDHRADIYSLGVIIYEMLTGERPFGAKNSPGVMVKHLRDEPPELPAHLAKSCWGEAVSGCMEKRPEKRIQEARVVRDILKKRDEARRASAPLGATAKSEAQPKADSRRKALLAAISIGVVAAVAIAGLLQFLPGTSDETGTGDETVVQPTASVDGQPADDQPKVSAAGDEPSEPSKLAKTPDTTDTVDSATPASPDTGATHVEADDTDAGAEQPPAIADRSGTIGTAKDPSTTRPGAPEPRPKKSTKTEKLKPHRNNTPERNANSHGGRANAGDGDRKAPAAKQAAEQVSLEIESTPPGARVLVSGRPAGTTPLAYKVEQSDAPVTVEFHLIGYRTKYQKVVPDKDQTIRVELEKGRLKLIP